jgi:MFS family permease
MRQLLADRNARLFVTGLLASSFGDTALYLAIAIWIRTLTGSTSAAGLVFVTFALGLLASPVTGVWVDRVRRRPLLVALNLATAAAVLVMLAGDDRHRLWIVYTIMAGYGLATSTMRSARMALLQTILPQQLVAEAISVIQVAGQILSLGAPLLAAGLLVTLGPAPVIITDAVTFLIAAATTLFITIDEATPDSPRRHWIVELGSGARYLWDTPVLRQLSVLASLIVVACAVQETTLFSLVAEGLHRPTAFIAVLATVEGIGAMSTGLTTPWLMRTHGRSAPFQIGLATAATGLLLQSVGPLACAVVGSFLIGAGMALISACYLTLFQLATPRALTGRTDAAFNVVLSLAQTAFVAVGAALNSTINYRITLLATVGVLLTSLLYWWAAQRRSAATRR